MINVNARTLLIAAAITAITLSAFLVASVHTGLLTGRTGPDGGKAPTAGNPDRGLSVANNDAFNFAPPTSAEDWTLRDRFLEPGTDDQIFGRRITPRDIIDFGDIYGLVYQSLDDDHPTTQAASIMFSRDKFHWVDSPANPIFGELEQPWQGTRAMAEALAYDDENERWVMFLTGNDAEHIPGIRAQGLIYSKDLTHWEYEPSNPVITAEDIDWTDGTTDRVYVRGVKKYRGLWYAWVQANTEDKDGRRYNVGVMISEDLIHWQPAEANPVLETGGAGAWDERQVLMGRPILFDGTWYLAYTNEGRNQVGLAWSDSIDGKWQKGENNPILDFDEITLDGTETPILTPMGAGWGILMAAWEPNDPRESAKLALATARFSPSILPDMVR